MQKLLREGAFKADDTSPRPAAPAAAPMSALPRGKDGTGRAVLLELRRELAEQPSPSQ